jgi:signal transduction histidine kinase
MMPLLAVLPSFPPVLMAEQCGIAETWNNTLVELAIGDAPGHAPQAGRSCIVMDAHVNRFLEGFSTGGREKLSNSVILENYEDRQFLFHEGDSADGVCMVLNGEIEVFRQLGNREQLLGVVSENDFLGELAVLDGLGRSASARTRGPATVGRIPTAVLIDVLDREPASVMLHVFRQLLSYLRSTNDLFLDEVMRKQKLSLLGEMACSLMHDLRNPLTGISLSADVLALKNPGDAEAERCCEGIRFQCDRVAAMTRELFEFSRGESTMHPSRTTAKRFLERFRSLHADYIQQTGLTFEMEADEAEIEIDGMRCMRLLQNLVTNAVEALVGREDGIVRLKAWVEEGFFCISVVDNGPGIPKEIRDKVFEPFVTHGKKGGIGLGMAIVQNVVTAHKGKIKLETNPEGTSFLIQMPQFVEVEAVPVTTIAA